MSNGWKISIVLDETRVIPLEKLTLKVSDEIGLLEGKVPYALAAAGFAGKMHYFAKARLHGFQAVIEQGAEKRHVWWLFEDFCDGSIGYVKPADWHEQQTFRAVISAAEYAVCMVSLVLADEKQRSQLPADAALPEKIEAIIHTFLDAMDEDAGAFVSSFLRPEAETEEDEDEELPYEVVTFVDKSTMQVTLGYYLAHITFVYEVPVLPAQANNRFRKVEIQHYSTAAQWEQ